MSSSEPQDDATQFKAWQYPEQSQQPPDHQQPAEAAPSWQGYQPDPTDYPTLHGYSPNPPAPAEYAQPPAEYAPPPAEYAPPPAPADYPAPPQAPAEYAPPPSPSDGLPPPPPAPSDYLPPEPAEHAQQAAPHPPGTNGYLAPPPDPADYVAPPHFVHPATDVPAGAGMVPPRSDARPPVPEQAPEHAPPDAEHQTADGWSATDYRGTYSEAQSQYPPAAVTPQAAAYPQTAPPTAPQSAPPGTPAWQPTGAPPKPEDLLVPDLTAIADEPARWGWRGLVNRLTGGAVSAKAKGAELADRKATRDIQRAFSRPMTVVVIQPKGGAGKTPTTIGIASALGVHRGGYVVGWDDNETRGTLAVRVTNRDSQRTTVWDLLGELPSFERTDARVGDLSYFVRAQGEAQFDALVSDDHPSNMAQIGEREFHRIHAVLQRFYRVVVIDTGNNVRSPNWQAAVNAADVVVIPSTYQRDVGFSASWVLDHLIQTGRVALAEHAVTVLTAADPSTDQKVRDELLRHFGNRTQNVVEIPYDAHIATGGPIHWDQLREATRRAWIQAGAVVVQALLQRDLPRR